MLHVRRPRVWLDHSSVALPAPPACAFKKARSKTLCFLQQAYQVLRHGGVKEDNIVVMVSP